MQVSKHSKYLKKVKARTTHECFSCGNIIVSDYYYRETDEEAFLQTINARAFCEDCYNKFGDKLLNRNLTRKIEQNVKNKKLEDF